MHRRARLLAAAGISVASLLASGAGERPGLPRVQIAARLELPLEERLGAEGRAFCAVALRPPFAYVLDRRGRLSVFQVPADAAGSALRAARVIDDAGDGNDLEVVGDVLFCTRAGGLEAHGLGDPAAPAPAGRVGPAGEPRDGRCIVQDGRRLFVVGKGTLTSYDVSSPHSPRLVSTLDAGGNGWVGCLAGNFLYVGEAAIGGTGRRGIAVYDVSDPSRLREAGFAPTERAPYHLFSAGGGRLLATFSDPSPLEPEPRVYGSAAIFGLDRPERPERIKDMERVGGRSAVLAGGGGDPFLLCNGGVFALAGDGVSRAWRFPPAGTTRDGFPYRGDAAGDWAALVLDGGVLVLRVGPPLTETEKIEALIGHVSGLRDATFVRNGTAYGASMAARFLRGKWKSNADRIRTARDFIEKAASVSTTSGKAYLIRSKDGVETPSGDYLRRELDRIEGIPSGPAGP